MINSLLLDEQLQFPQKWKSSHHVITHMLKDILLLLQKRNKFERDLKKAPQNDWKTHFLTFFFSESLHCIVESRHSLMAAVKTLKNERLHVFKSL